jgi:signal peptidase I
MAATTKKKAKGPVANIVELVVTVAIAVGLALLIQAFLVKPYRIPSGSMIPTLSIGQRILVNRLDTHPGLGDVVVFHPPTGAVTGNDGNGVCGNPAQGGGHPQPCDKNLPSESSQTFVKRVVGLPGDHLRIVKGYVYRNGQKETFGYHPKADANISQFIVCNGGASTNCTFSKSITVPAGDYYMMGDNRGDSLDSRYWGPVPQKWIIGVAFATYWPIDRIGFF